MKPLGLPEGSIRAIMLIALVFSVVFPVLVFVFRQADIPPTIDKYLTSLLAAVILLVREYIGLRAEADKKKDEPKDGQ